MGLVINGLEHYKKYGFYNLLGAGSKQLFGVDYVTTYLFPIWYRSKTITNPWFNYKGVLVNLEHEMISDTIKKKFMTGYELKEISLIEDHLGKSANIIELGSGLGVTSCFINNNVDIVGVQLAIEANPDLESVIKSHKDQNDATFDVVNKAYSTDGDLVTFHSHGDFYSSGTEPRKSTYNETMTVPTTNLLKLVNDHSLDEFDLIADIEGEEHSLFEQEIELLNEKCNLIIIEMHNIDVSTIEDGLKHLEINGFSQIDQMGNVYVLENNTIEKN